MSVKVSATYPYQVVAVMDDDSEVVSVTTFSKYMADEFYRKHVSACKGGGMKGVRFYRYSYEDGEIVKDKEYIRND